VTFWFPAKIGVWIDGKWNPFKHGKSDGIRQKWVVTDGKRTLSAGYHQVWYDTKKEAQVRADDCNGRGQVHAEGHSHPLLGYDIPRAEKYRPKPKATP
jgi:hypothetical protein